MEYNFPLVEIAAQLADNSRVTMVLELMDGSSKTASELAIAANISASSASMHLAKLVNAGILGVTQEGRHKFYRVRSPSVAYAVEALAVAADLPLPNQDPANRGIIQDANPWAFARTCFDHLAGLLGVEVTAALQRRDYIRHDDAEGYIATPKGKTWFADMEIDCDQLEKERRAFATHCLDWSERRSHLGGALGAALLLGMHKMGWIAKSRIPRLVRLTLKGETELRDRLSIAFGRGLKNK
jgi:DNA-binding transcriptional ArsR family regulator